MIPLKKKSNCSWNLCQVLMHNEIIAYIVLPILLAILPAPQNLAVLILFYYSKQ